MASCEHVRICGSGGKLCVLCTCDCISKCFQLQRSACTQHWNVRKWRHVGHVVHAAAKDFDVFCG